MSPRALVGLIVALVASSGQSPVQLSALAEAAPPAPAPTVQVEVIDVEEEVPVPGGPSVLVPATLCSNQIDWLVGMPATRVQVTVHAIDLTKEPHVELTVGEMDLQHCALHRRTLPLPRLECDAARAGWVTGVRDPDISIVPPIFHPVPPSDGTGLGLRFLYVPVHGSGLDRATSDSFNIYRGDCGTTP